MAEEAAEGEAGRPLPDKSGDREEGKPTAAEAETWRPFMRDDMPLSAVERLKFAVGLLTLLPVRLVLVLLVIALMALWASLLQLLPVSRRRDAVLRWSLARGARVCLFLFGFYWIEREDEGGCGPDARRGDAPGEPALIVANHVSWIDAPLLMAECGFPAFVAKASVGALPVVGGICRSNHAVLVSRHHHEPGARPPPGGACGGGAGSNNCTQRVVEHQRRYEAEGAGRFPRLVIFPEGTTSNGRHLLYFHRGSFAAGRPVRPVLIRYPHRRFSPSWESFFFVPHALHSLCQLRQRVVVRYLAVYRPSAAERADAGVYAEGVRARLAEASGLPVCESRFRDKARYHRWLSRENGIRPTSLRSQCFDFFLARALRLAPAPEQLAEEPEPEPEPGGGAVEV